MNTIIGLEHCFSFINCHLQQPGNTALFAENHDNRRAITISRQSGCGAHAVAERLARRLQSHAPAETPPWTVFDRNLVERVLQDHQLPERFARFMPEDRVREIEDIMHDLFGVHPPSEMLAQKTSETILRLAEWGNVIILGRGANIVTAKLPHMLHVRMIASLETRIENMRHFEGLEIKEAIERIHREDLGRERYLKRHFGKDINDPLLYHLAINTDLITIDEAVQIIAGLVCSGKVLQTV